MLSRVKRFANVLRGFFNCLKFCAFLEWLIWWQERIKRSKSVKLKPNIEQF